MNVRLLCEDCGVKWFIPNDGDAGDESIACGACGGRLVAFDAPDGDEEPGWTRDAE
jgi:hypothetical protein